ncbi:C40 family peptidase [Aureispira sp. CCB-E]|uniref:C40 family peptidase n=1 Tax=Aureispira sp. CCB-E TaxID=3051121 RepID=UPI0028689B97|nr:C40 family peptidase [Aureispira sp. CCB-E]WMX17197.1 C40 family peptidase [Aureispira sp. CCB-E]
MKYTQKSVATIVSTYFFFLIGTNVTLHATLIPTTPVSESISLSDSDVNLLATRSAVVSLEDEDVISEDEMAEEEIVEEVAPILIDHSDITGLKRIVINKRKRNQRKANALNNRLDFAGPANVPSVPVAYNAIFDSLTTSGVRGNIIEEAKKYLGLKYIWGGTTPKGFDCSGFTSYVMAQKGVGIARSSRYQARQGQNVDISKAKTGDLVFFSKYGKGGRVTHVAMVVDNKKDGVYIIHSTRRGIVVDNLSESSYWKPKVLYAKDVISKEKKTQEKVVEEKVIAPTTKTTAKG